MSMKVTINDFVGSDKSVEPSNENTEFKKTLEKEVEKYIKDKAMPTNEERQEVAGRLKSEKESSGLFDNAFLELFRDVIGRYPDRNLSRGKCETELLFKRLADLIEPEPTVERDALLALARDLEVSIMESGACGDVAGLVLNIVKQIREACGEVSNNEV